MPNSFLGEYPTLAEYLIAAKEKSVATFNEVQIILERGKVAKFVVEFNGSGDSGQVEGVTGFDVNNAEVALTDDVEKTVTEYADTALDHMPYDWVNNEGGWGELHINMQNGEIKCEYNQRIETSEYHELILEPDSGAWDETSSVDPDPDGDIK